MYELLELLKDGKSRSLTMLAAELGRSREQVARDIDFLEKAGVIRRVEMHACGGNCSGCSTDGGSKSCPGCMPEGGFKNMGVMWEIV